MSGLAGRADPGFDQARLQALFARHASRGTVPADRTLDFGAGGMHVVTVHEGALLASIELPDDRRQVLCFYWPGDVLFAELFRPERSVRLRALRHVAYSGMTAAEFAAARAETPEAVPLLLSAALRNLSDLMLHSAAIGRLRSEERLATFFLELALRTGHAGRDAVTLDFEMRRDDVADYLGLNRDTLSRAMSKLRRDKVLTFITAGRVVARLEALSERTPLARAMLMGRSAA